MNPAAGWISFLISDSQSAQRIPNIMRAICFSINVIVFLFACKHALTQTIHLWDGFVTRSKVRFSEDNAKNLLSNIYKHVILNILNKITCFQVLCPEEGGMRICPCLGVMITMIM